MNRTGDNGKKIPLIPRWDLGEFRDLIQDGINYGCFHFFLIKKCGFRLMTRETDYLPSIGTRLKARQSVAHAKGLNRDFVRSDEKAFWELRDKVDELCTSDICEWFALSEPLLNEVEDKISDGFSEIQFVFKKLEYDNQCYDEYSLASLECGEMVLNFNVDIDWSGGGCPETSMISKIAVSYVKEKKLQQLNQEYGDKPFHINRSMALAFKRFTVENYPNGFFEDDADELIEENDINTETAQMIEETPESKLIDKLLEYRSNITEEQGCSKATMNLIEFIAYSFAPEDFIEILDAGETLAEAIRQMVEWTTTKEGLKDYLHEKVLDEGYLTEFGVCPSGALDYLDIDSFMKDLDYDYVIHSIKTCWSMVSDLSI